MRHTLGLMIALYLVTYAPPGLAREKVVNKAARHCATDLESSPAFGSLADARAALARVRPHLGHYLPPADVARLYALIDNADDSTGNDASALDEVNALFERSEQNFYREFNAQADLADEAIAARIKAARHGGHAGALDGTMGLRSKFKTCRQNPSFQNCAAAWRRIQNEFKLKRAPRTYVAKAPGGRGLPTDEVFRLDVLGSEDQKDAFRAALARTFESRGAEVRQARRDEAEALGRGRRHEYTRLTNLNRSLSLFLEPPRIIELPSKVILSGSARIGDVISVVNVVFDPRDRYVTIQRPNGDGDDRYYFKVELLGDGRVALNSEAPIPKDLVYQNLRDTHLAY